MKSANFILACSLILVLSLMLGCASLEGGQASGINWALKENGGEVTAFSENPGHPASTLNNGITSSENWGKGEGWQASMGASAGFGRQGGGAGGRGGGAGMPGGGFGGRGGGARGQERNWVIIDLPQSVTVTHVKIHTIDSKQYPAKDFGVSYLLVQYESKATLGEAIWKSADRYGKGVGSRDNIIRDNAKGVINVRFVPIRTKRIRVLIYGTNDMASSIGRRGGRGGSRGRGGTIRLTEIEVYGV